MGDIVLTGCPTLLASATVHKLQSVSSADAAGSLAGMLIDLNSVPALLQRLAFPLDAGL